MSKRLTLQRRSVEETSTLDNVFYLPTAYSMGRTKESNSIIDLIIGNPEIEAYLSDFIEGAMIKIAAAKFAQDHIITDNPFDSIYLSELEPDFLDKKDIQNVEVLAGKIIDLSDTIKFNDGWDD